MEKDINSKENEVKRESDLKILNSSEEKFKASEDMYKNIINNLMDIIIVLDLKGNFLYASPQIYSISGFTQEEIIGKNGFKFMHPDDIKEAVNVLKEAIDKKIKVYFEYRTKHKEGYYIDVSASGKIVNIEGEDRIFTVVRDISAQKRSEKKLKESEKKYKTLSNELEAIFDRIPATIFRKNRNGEYTQVNQAFADAFNLNKKDIIGKTPFNFFPSDQAEVFHNNDLKVMMSGKPHLDNEMNVDVDGKKRRLIINKIPQFNADGDVIGLIGITTDISQQIAYEQELIESEKKYRQLIEGALGGVWVIDEDANTTLVNSSMARILGYEVDELLGRNLFDFTLQEDIESTKNTLERRKKGIKEEIEKKFIRKDGKKVITRLMTSPIFNNDGKYKGAIAFVSDITERKKTENLLKESEEKFRTLFELAPASTVVSDSEGRIILYNQKFCKIHGITKPESLVGRRVTEFFAKKDWPKLTESIMKTAKGITLAPIEYTMLREDGTQFQAEASSSGIRNKNGNIVNLIGVAQDITERKKTEKSLRDSEEKYSHLFMSSPYSIIIGDMDGKIIDCNFIEDKISGYNREDIIGRSMLDVPMFPHETLPIVMKDLQALLKGEIPQPSELQIIKKDGSRVWVQPSASMFKLKDKIYLQIIMQDINNRKESEEKLRGSEEKFRSLFEIVPASITVLDLNGNIVLYNQKFCEIHGVSKPELLEGRSVRDFFKENDLPKLKEAMNKSLEGRSRGFNHYTMIKEDGTEFLAEAISVGIKDKKGKITSLIGVAQDVTERIRAEQKLKESEEKFRMIAEHSSMGVLITVDDKIEYVNNALLHIFEYSNKEIENWTRNNIIQMIHPDDLQFLREYRKKLREGDPNVKPYYSYRVFTKSGKLKWVDQSSTVIKYMGRPAELVTVVNITEKKAAEQELVKLDSLKSELMRRTSHELKTPLVSIKGYSDLLLNVHKDNLDDYVLASIVEIKKGCERLESLIQDILNTAKLESGEVQLDKIVEDLSFFIKLSVRELQGLAKLRNQTISITSPDKLITSFEPEQMHQVISNLINNAIKYTPPDGTIEIVSEIKDNFIIVSIKDSGIGLTKEEKGRLFTQFGKIERYGQGLDIISDGSGLGLYITKKIVDLHGGKIWVESEGRNKGSTFYFSLPIIIESND